MKSSIHLFGALFILLSGHAQATALYFETPGTEVSIGDNFTVGVGISGLGDHTAPSLSVFDLEIDFDPDMLRFESANFSGYLGDIAAFEATVLNDGLIDSDTVRIGESSLLEENDTTCIFCVSPYLEDLQPASFTFTTLHFQALAVGDTPLFLRIDSIGNGQGAPLSVDTQNTGSVHIASAVPLPDTIPLLCFGLGVLGLVRGYRQV